MSLKEIVLKSFKETSTGCWEWQGNIKSNGYGRAFYQSKVIMAHRASYQELVSPIGDKWVLHKCDNKRCINPDHLYLGTHADNMKDVIDRKRHPHKRTNRCNKGHDLNDRPIIQASGSRRCRTCQYEAIRKYKMKIRKGKK